MLTSNKPLSYTRHLWKNVWVPRKKNGMVVILLNSSKLISLVCGLCFWKCRQHYTAGGKSVLPCFFPPLHWGRERKVWGNLFYVECSCLWKRAWNSLPARLFYGIEVIWIVLTQLCFVCEYSFWIHLKDEGLQILQYGGYPLLLWELCFVDWELGQKNGFSYLCPLLFPVLSLVREWENIHEH